MSAPTKFLFDTDFAGGDRKPAERTITLAEHAVKLAEAETAAHRRGYAEAQADATVESDRRIADALERIAASLAAANDALQAIEARLECEAVEVAVAVARKLAPALIAREPFAEIAALASDCFRELVSSPHIAVRVNDALYATAKEKLDDIVRAAELRRPAGGARRTRYRARRLPHRMGGWRHQSRQRRGRRLGDQRRAMSARAYISSAHGAARLRRTRTTCSRRSGANE